MTDAPTLTACQSSVDHAASEAESVWGVDRLPRLVSTDTQAKLIRQQRRWRQAMEAAWNALPMCPKPILDAATSSSAAMVRAWSALAAEASEAGHRPLSSDVWEIELNDGTVCALTRTTEEAAAVTREGRHLVVYSAQEIANVIDALGVLHMAKVEFPGARVSGRADYSWKRDGEAIPFGEPLN